MKITKLLLTASALASLSAFACGGSSGTTANTSTSPSPQSSTIRALSGSLNLATLSASNSISPSSSSSAPEDWSVDFVDNQNTHHRSAVNTSGHFRAELETGKDYHVEVEHVGQSLGQIQFALDAQSNFDTPSFHLSDSSSEVELGEIECEHGVCSSTQNPRSQTDRDGDGISDLNDQDETRQEDRNHDGVSDNAEDSPSHLSTNDCELIRSNPNQAETGVNTNETIRLRFSNAIDASSINSSSIQFETGGVDVPYTVSIENEDEHGDIRLEPSTALIAATAYTIHVTTDLTCSNGTHPANALAINFTTKN